MARKELLLKVAKWAAILFVICLPFIFLKMYGLMLSLNYTRAFFELIKNDDGLRVLIKMDQEELEPKKVELAFERKLALIDTNLSVECQACDDCGPACIDGEIILKFSFSATGDYRLERVEFSCGCRTCTKQFREKLEAEVKPFLEKVKKIVAKRTHAQTLRIKEAYDKFLEAEGRYLAYDEWLEKYLGKVPFIGRPLCKFITDEGLLEKICEKEFDEIISDK